MSSPESSIRKGILLKGGVLAQIQFAETGDSLRSAVYIQLAVDMLKMHLDSVSGKKQFLGNRIIGETLGDQMQHFEFAGGERINKSGLENWGIDWPNR